MNALVYYTQKILSFTRSVLRILLSKGGPITGPIHAGIL